MEDLGFSRKFVKTYRKGESIFLEGDSGTELYAVLQGSVNISRRADDGEPTLLRCLEQGEIFGEMGLLDNAPRSASANADQDDTRVVVIDQAKFIYLVSQQPVFALDIMQVLCRRIRMLEEKAQGNTS